MSESRFGKYNVLKRIGVGGMAEVFQCRVKGLGGFDKLVVVKRILAAHLEDDEFVRMLLDEGCIAASLNHSNIVQVFEVDQIGAVPYIAMEFVRGPTLTVLLRQAQKKDSRHFGHAAKILSGVCAGLHHAHTACDARGEPLHIVHRDVSPENILISAEGVPKLLDFGVAKARGKMTTTDPGRLRGKLRFMAPELLRGEPAEPGTDVFAAGACLYEATVGRAAFSAGSEPELTAAVLRGATPAPSKVVPDYPAELEHIVLWAMHPDRRKRCPSAMALRGALEQFTGSGAHASSTHLLAAWVAELFKDSPHVAEGVYGTTPTRPPALPMPPPPPDDAGILALLPDDTALGALELIDAEPDLELSEPLQGDPTPLLRATPFSTRRALEEPGRLPSAEPAGVESPPRPTAPELALATFPAPTSRPRNGLPGEPVAGRGNLESEAQPRPAPAAPGAREHALRDPARFDVKATPEAPGNEPKVGPLRRLRLVRWPLRLFALGALLALAATLAPKRSRDLEPGAADRRGQVLEYLRKAEDRAGRRDYDEALDLLDKARATKPSDAALWVGIARTERACALAMARDALRRNDAKTAYAAAQRILATDSGNGRGLRLAEQALTSQVGPPPARP